VENPYQPPAAAGEIAVSPVAGLKNPRPLALIAVWLYGIATVAQVIDHLWRSLVPLPSLPFPASTPASSATNEHFGTMETHVHDTYYVDSGFGLFDWLMLLTGLGSGIVYLVWKYRAATNARILDPAAMKVSPGMAVGSYFIPLVFFVVPYQAMAGIARATLGSAAGVGLWWACHVIGTLAGFWVGLTMASGAMASGNPFTRPTLIEHLYLLGTVITFLISTWLVLKITRAQTARWRG